MNIEKLRDAAAMFDGVPAGKVYLDAWIHSRYGCGTVACFGGTVALHGGFGLSATPKGSDAFKSASGETGWLALREVFDMTQDEASELFDTRGSSRHDHDAPRHLCDKELVRWRVVHFMRRRDLPVSKAYARGW